MMSSIAEPGANKSQPKTQSDLMNNHSEDFIPIDKKKWNDIPTYGDVKREDSCVEHLENGNKFGTPP